MVSDDDRGGVCTEAEQNVGQPRLERKGGLRARGEVLFVAINSVAVPHGQGVMMRTTVETLVRGADAA